MRGLNVAMLAAGTAVLALGLQSGPQANAPQAGAAYEPMSTDRMLCKQKLLERGERRLPEKPLVRRGGGRLSDQSDEDGEAACATDRNFIEPTPPPRTCEPNAERHDQPIFCWWAGLRFG